MHTIGIILTAHGDFAPALLRAAELIVGSQPGVMPLCLSASDSPESHATQLQAVLAQVDSGSGVLVLTDLLGGSPANIASLSLGQGVSAVLCGVNLPMLLEALTRRDELALPDLAAAAIRAGQSGIVDAGATLSARQTVRLASDSA